MIYQIVTLWEKNKQKLRDEFRKKEPESYDDIFTALITNVLYDLADKERITTISHGEYGGTKLFIVGENGYQPEVYWVCRVIYGSCSECDTFYNVEINPNKRKRIRGYMRMALHMVQALHEIRSPIILKNINKST